MDFQEAFHRKPPKISMYIENSCQPRHVSKTFLFASQGVGTQGADRDNWVTMYTLEWSEEGESWEPYQEDGHDKVLCLSLSIWFHCPSVSRQ